MHRPRPGAAGLWPAKAAQAVDRCVRALSARACDGLTGRRLWRELGERGYQGGYTAVTDVLRDIRPASLPTFEVRFETPPGDQAQVDFAQFQVVFADEPPETRIVWLFSFVLVYSRALIDFARHHAFQPKACRPYRAKTKGKVERPYRYIREDFFLARSFRNLDDLNGQLRHWLDTVANPRVHATTQRVINEAFAEEKPHLKALPLAPFRSVLKLERRVSHEGMVSVGGNLYSVPDATRKRIVEVHTLADVMRITDRRHHDPIWIVRTGDVVAARPLEFYQAVGQRLACQGDQP